MDGNMCIVISIVNDMAELNNWINYKRDILSSFGSVPMYRWGVVGSEIVLFELGYRTLLSVIGILGYTIVHSEIF